MAAMIDSARPWHNGIPFQEREFDLGPAAAHNVGKRTTGAAGVRPPESPVESIR
jgi:hypothetical protein